MKTTKIIALLLAVLLMAGIFSACASKGPDVAIRTNVPRDTLIVAYGANMNGDFINGFGNNAYDLSIKTLLHGYMGNYTVTPAGEYVINPTVVKDTATATDAAGNKTYTFTLHNDLKWSDGSAITAKDFVTAVLWQASPQWLEAGGSSALGYGLLGYSAYYSGENEYFEGVQLIDELVFSLTIDAEELPFFYEVTYVYFDPFCKATYVPSIDIVSDANGARFGGDIMADCQRIAETSGGERFAPTVVAGPYTFVSFENQIATLKRNPNFKGDVNGKKPTIEYIVQQAVPEETDVDILLAGDLDLLPTMIEGEKIERAKADEFTSTSSHLRNGYGVMHMICAWGPTADPNVRWAITSLVNRTALLDQVLGGYGGLVDSEYGVAQWMYQMKEQELNAALTPISFNIDKANDYLDQSVWVFEADGSTPFDRDKANAEGTYLRHNANGDALIINHAAAAASVGAVLEIEFLRNTPLAGIRYNFDSPDFNLILDQFYYGSELDDNERIYSTFSMGTGFVAAYDPYFSWHSDWAGTTYNPAGLRDAQLDAMIMEMRRFEPTEKDAFAAKWVEYQVRWQQLMPSFPLYANEYFNLFNSSVKGVPTTPFLDWYEIICEIEKYPE
ncbi:MAG: ABC transporter substrate-binding protein [Oscillospiraceae bacterium]|nr:ABC transporter substrate-binding protein [Oscillospiraceae bacterium]